MEKSRATILGKFESVKTGEKDEKGRKKCILKKPKES